MKLLTFFQYVKYIFLTASNKMTLAYCGEYKSENIHHSKTSLDNILSSEIYKMLS